MENRIREYIDGIFQKAPQTQKAYELKVELTQNLMDKYYTLIAEGKSEEDAYNITIMSIGNIEELFAGLEDTEYKPYTYPGNVPPVKRSAAITAIAVMLYILSVVPVIILESFGDAGENLGAVMMFVIVAVATGLLVYNHKTKPKKNPVQPGNVVDDFKEWRSAESSNQQLHKTIRLIFWPLVVAIYFLLSFSTGAWYITWIIFLIAPAVDTIISAALSMYGK